MLEWVIPSVKLYFQDLKLILWKLLKHALAKKLKDIKLIGVMKRAYVLFICSKGYPENYEKNLEIKNLKISFLKKMNLFFMLAQ